MAGIFPPSYEKEPDDSADIASAAVLERPDSLRNYKGVEEDLTEARQVRVARLLQEDEKGGCRSSTKNRTVSGLGLVLKKKDTGGTKRRIILTPIQVALLDLAPFLIATLMPKAPIVFRMKHVLSLNAPWRAQRLSSR